MSCPSCGTDNPEGAKFCNGCGAQLVRACPSCGTSNAPGAKFCSECGTTLQVRSGPAPPAVPAAERRLVTVLFADLVGFTSLSESRDAEETRDLLSRYFELSSTLISRYGGTVEKFIGDAVMAVWGTPTATEDDAERTVRAALDLVESIPGLDPALQARAGVLTGEAAVTIGAEGQGMVAGDLVNTASRIQSTADPGTVLVGDVTRRSTEQAIVYQDAGAHELKGKSEPVALFRALRVVSGVGGMLKSAGLEAPFVGRDRELKLIKDLFHGAAEDGRAHLVSVTGIAGIGKSRLAWEFYKYFDGIVEQVYWHRGRCLPYGEGVAYWALADMVRMRCRIGEDEPADSARRKLQATLDEHILDAGERAFVAPRIAHLLGLDEAAAGDRQDLFAAWRLFFERLADVFPTVLAFEDMQWADASLLDFVEYLLEWSRDNPLFVITLARPELQEKRSNWGAGQRNFTSLYLDPLSGAAMGQLLEGLVPGLPVDLHTRILARAQGVPLYAVETVRMLLDRGLLVQEGSVYRPAGEIETLEVPETLHALIAARLDGVSTEERRLLQDGAVLGKTFTQRALGALSGRTPEELEPLLAGLVRKEVLGVQSDPRSPERGQYGFLQDLVRHVAYETLSKRDRKNRHLAAAEHLQSAFADEDEVAEVLAAHYLAAVEAAPDADDAGEIRARGGEMLARAGARAASLGATEEARRYYEQAAELAEESVLEAALLLEAGRLAVRAYRPVEARERLERAIGLFGAVGDLKGAARGAVALADVELGDGRLDEAIARFEGAVAELEQGPPSAELAAALAQLGRVHVIAGRGELALPPLERALAIAERRQVPEVFVEALTSKGLVLGLSGRFDEARILLRAAVERAYAEELFTSALRAENNLAVILQSLDLHVEALAVASRCALLARRRGDRRWESTMRVGSLIHLYLLGRWDEAAAIAAEERPIAVSTNNRAELLTLTLIHCWRGETEEARAFLETDADLRTSANPQASSAAALFEAFLLRFEGAPREALAAAERGFAHLGDLPISETVIKLCLIEVIESALALGDLDKAAELLAVPESLDPGDMTPLLEANALRLRARLDAARGDQAHVDARYRSAAARSLEFDLPVYLALTQLEHGEWLEAQGRADEAEPLLSEAASTFERLEAVPWLERARRTSASASGVVSSAITSNQT